MEKYRVVIVDVKASKKYSLIEIKFYKLHAKLEIKLFLMLANNDVLRNFIENYEKAFPEWKRKRGTGVKENNESKTLTNTKALSFSNFLPSLKLVHDKCVKLESEIETLQENFSAIEGISGNEVFVLEPFSKGTQLMEKYYNEFKLIPEKLKSCSKEFFTLYNALQKDYPELYKNYCKAKLED